MQDKKPAPIRALFENHGRDLLSAEICARRVSGGFRKNEPHKALREIKYFLGLRAIRQTDYLQLLAE